MDFVSVGKVAMELGVIPAVALFLVVPMHIQNRRLTSTLEQREQNSFDVLKILIAQIAESKKHPGGS